MSSRAMEYLTSFFKIVFKYLINTATRGGGYGIIVHICIYPSLILINVKYLNTFKYSSCKIFTTLGDYSKRISMPYDAL